MRLPARVSLEEIPIPLIMITLLLAEVKGDNRVI